MKFIILKSRWVVYARLRGFSLRRDDYSSVSLRRFARIIHSPHKSQFLHFARLEMACKMLKFIFEIHGSVDLEEMAL